MFGCTWIHLVLYVIGALVVLRILGVIQAGPTWEKLSSGADTTKDVAKKVV